MKSPNSDFEMSILVGHKSINEYSHEGMVFVEGRNGSPYKIRIRNNTYRRACFVVSVDGLSVLDGKDAADNSPGYVLNAHESLDIECYKVDDKTGAKFVFGTKEGSYTAEMGNGTDNTGVIAVKAYHEKYQPLPPPIYHHGFSYPKYSTGMGGALRSSGTAASTKGWGLGGLNSNSAEASFSCGNVQAYSADDAGRGIAPTSVEPVEQQLGTVFGEAMQWQTTTVNFVREYFGTVMMVYYDNKKNLERRGIRFEKKAKPLPDPFPGNEKGCAAPPGWRK